MPIWGWILLAAVLTVVMVPIKMKLLKKLLEKKNQNNELDD